MKPPYLDPTKWIQSIKDLVSKTPIERFKSDSDLYILPWQVFEFSDLEDEIYSDEKPYSVKRFDMGEYGTEEDWGGFDAQEAFDRDIFPELKAVADKVNQMLGGDFFDVQKDPMNQGAEVNFIFSEEEIPLLQEYGILTKTPNLSAVLASGRAFADFNGPLFERADVKVRMEVNPEGRQIPVPTSAKLILPDLNSNEAERVPSSFQITVKKRFEDDRALVKTFAFTFSVTDMKFEPLANGQVRPRFKSELKEYRHA